MARPASKKAPAGEAAAAKAGKSSAKESKEKEEKTTASRKQKESVVHSLYDLLGVAKDASPRDITAAYRRRALMCHPDKVRQRQTKGAGKNQGEEENKAPVTEEEATKHFQQLQAAYNVLSDPKKRERYDRTGKFNGDLTHFFEFIPLSDPSDFKRYTEIISKLVKDKKVKETPAYKKSVRDFEDIAKKYQKKFEKEKKAT
ncbi:hypothetical protein Emed_006805 [Eimeria media]